MTIQAQPHTPQSLRPRIDWFFASLGQGLNANGLTRQRMDSLIALDALSDPELAILGLRRCDVVPFVFRDLFPM